MGFTISIMWLFMFLMFAAVFGLIIYKIVNHVSEEAKNSKAPVLTVEAKVVSKRTSVSGTGGSMQMNGMYSSGTTSTSYYVTFQAPDGSRLELKVPGKKYGMLAEGDTGLLTYQRKRFVGYKRRISPAPAVSEDEALLGRVIANQLMQEPEVYRHSRAAAAQQRQDAQQAQFRQPAAQPEQYAQPAQFTPPAQQQAADPAAFNDQQTQRMQF